MPNVNYFFASWSTTGNDFYPGQSHSWMMWGFGYGDVVSVTAHPVAGPAGDRFLVVEDVKIEGDSTGRRLYFTVRNVGNISMPGYGMGFSWITR